MVMVWLPELPPMPATIGISAASATSFSIEPSKAPITREAMNAVTRLIASQVQRFLKLFQHRGEDVLLLRQAGFGELGSRRCAARM